MSLCVIIPHENFTNTIPADHLDFGELSCNVFVDEYYTEHKSIYDWLYNNFTWVNQDYTDIYSDGILLTYNNSLKVVVLEIKVKNMHPISFTSIEKDNVNTNEQGFDVVFGYDYYTPDYKML